jgi:hypothetical protein
MQRSFNRRTYGKGNVGRFCSFAGLLVFLSVVAVPPGTKAIEVPDVTGTWDLTVTAGNPGADSTGSSLMCRWVGLMMLTQTSMMGRDFMGSMTLHRVFGSSQCPEMLDGTLEGTIGGTGSGFTIDFGLASGEFGQVTFTGILMVDGQSANGTWSNTESGTWSAQRHSQAAPALGAGALATLFGLLLAGGVLRLRHRSV